MPTLMGSAIGTPQYMSPEQAAGRLDKLGAWSDVYSLGATLFSLLTGEAAFQAFDVNLILEMVKKGDFPRPRSVNPRVPAALDAVCLKAMAFDPDDRYATAKSLAVDVEHWLADEPVTAYREPFVVRARRWAKRHRPAVAAGLGIVVTGIVTLAVSNVLIARERDRTVEAKREADENYLEARGAVEKMLDEVAAIDLAEVPLMEPVRRKMLTTALAFYHRFLQRRSNDPSLLFDHGRAHVRLGEILDALGDSSAAEESFRKAIERLDDLIEKFPNRPEYRRSLAAGEFGYGILLKNANRFREADDFLRRSLADRLIVAKKTGDSEADRREVSATKYHLGALLARQRGRTPEDENMYRAALEEQRKIVEKTKNAPDSNRDLARNLNNLGILLRGTDPVAAESHFREALALQLRLEQESPDSALYRWLAARTASNLGGLLGGQREDRRKDAMEYNRQALARFGRLAHDFPKIPDYRQELAAVEDNQGILIENECDDLDPTREMDAAVALFKMIEAERHFANAVAIRDSLANEFPNRPDYAQNLAVVLRHQADRLRLMGMPDQAAPKLERALSIQTGLAERYETARHYDVELARTHDVAAQFAYENERQTIALDHLDKAVGLWKPSIAAEPKLRSYKRAIAQDYLLMAAIQLELGKIVESFDAVDLMVEALPDDPNELRRAARFYAMGVARLVEDSTRTPETRAAEFDRRAHRTLDLLRRAFDAGFRLPRELDDKSYDAIRDRADFRNLKREIEAKSAPAAG